MDSSQKSKKPDIKLIEDPKTTKYYIDTNNLIMNEIQELLTDQDMIKKRLIEQDEYHYTLEIIFPEEITQRKTVIKFLLLISKEHPNKEPQLYCLTVFSHPHLCDGRNLINNVINDKWSNKKYPLESIINKIPKFIIKYTDTDYNSTMVGKYIPNEIYKINFLKKLPIFLHFITNENEILTISDISLCIFILDTNLGFCKLSFFIDIKNIVHINPNPKKNKIVITYKNSSESKHKKININTANVETITTILNEKIKIYRKKSGKLPDINIRNVEKEIEEKEKELKDNDINIDKKLYLMSLYQKAVEYYSAVNNPKFIEITNKIHKLLANTQLDKISNDSKTDKKAEEKINNNIKNNDINEEKIENKKEEKNIINNYTNNNGIKKEENKNIPIKIEQEKEENKNIQIKIEQENENKNRILTKIEDKAIISHDIKNNKEEEKIENKNQEKIFDIEEKKEIIKTEKKGFENGIKTEEIKSEDKKVDMTEKNEEKNINIIENKDIDKKDMNIDKKIVQKINNENRNDKNISKNKEDNDNKEDKENKETKPSLKLKIDEGELGTLDVGDEEEEEEEEK